MELSDGIYESHVNFFVVAKDFEDARARIKENPEFKSKRMHVDGLQQLDAVDGYRLRLESDESLAGKSAIISSRHRDLAPKKPASP